MLMRSEWPQRRSTFGHASIFPSERQLIRYGRRAKGRSQAKNGRIRTRLDHHCLEVIYHRYLLFFYLFQRAIVLPLAPQATAGRSVKPLFHSSYNIFSFSSPFLFFLPSDFWAFGSLYASSFGVGFGSRFLSFCHPSIHRSFLKTLRGLRGEGKTV